MMMIKIIIVIIIIVIIIITNTRTTKHHHNQHHHHHNNNNSDDANDDSQLLSRASHTFPLLHEGPLPSQMTASAPGPAAGRCHPYFRPFPRLGAIQKGPSCAGGNRHPHLSPWLLRHSPVSFRNEVAVQTKICLRITSFGAVVLWGFSVFVQPWWRSLRRP